MPQASKTWAILKNKNEKATYFICLHIWHLSYDALVLHDFVHNLLHFRKGDAFLLLVVGDEEVLYLVLLPLDEFIFSVLAKAILVLLLPWWYWNPSIGLGLKELPSPLHGVLLFLLISFLDGVELSVKVFFTLREDITSVLAGFKVLIRFLWSNASTLGKTILLFAQFLSLDSLSDGYNMSIKSLDLWHEIYNLHTIVWLLC